MTILLNKWQLRLPQSLACCCSPDTEATSVESLVRLSLLPDHPVAALICIAFWPLRYRAGVIAVIILKRSNKSLVIMLPVAFNGN